MPEAKGGTSKVRFVVLDGVRGVAAIGVLAFHIIGGIHMHGWCAVDLFFLLSGFVLAHAYGRRFADGLSFAKFMEARIVRLYPLYAVAMASGIALLWNRLFPERNAVLLNAVWLPDVAKPGNLFPFNPPSWSLAGEMAINIVFGWFAGSRRSMALALAAGIAWLAVLYVQAGSFMSAMHVLNGGWNGPSWSTGFARVLYGFPLGVLLYRLHRAGGHRLPRISGWWLVAVTAAVLAMPNRADKAIPFSAIVLGLVWPAIIAFGAVASFGPLGERFFSWLGAISYAVYAMQVAVLGLVHRFAPARFHGRGAIGAAAVVATAHVLTFHVEPFLRERLKRGIDRGLRWTGLRPVFRGQALAPQGE